MEGRFESARKAAGSYREIFGKDNFFLEIQDQGLEMEHRIQADLFRLEKETGIPMLATNDSHYLCEDDAHSHDVLVCVQTGKTLADPGRFRFDARDFYLKSAQEMRALWSELPEACDSTLEIAERCEVSFAEGRDLMPRFPVPVGETEESWLVKEVERGLAARFPGGVPDQHRAQAHYEVGVICQMGFPSYFLVVADLCRYAKESHIRVGPGRGSAAGAVIAYALGITELDPIKHGLLFERFLNPERISMPDFDIDFCQDRRDEVIRYVQQKYGRDRVAQIITFGKLQARAVLRDVGRVLGMPYGQVDRLSKLVPYNPAHPVSLEKAIWSEPQLQQLRDSDESVARLLSPVPISFDQAIAIAVVGLAVNLASAWLLRESDGHHHHDARDHHHRHRDHNLRSAYMHVLADALTSVLAIAGLLAGRLYGWIWMDPLMGIVGAAVIAAWSWGLLRSSGVVLLDVVTDATFADHIRERMEVGDDRVADLHLWRVGPGHSAAIVSVVCDQPQPPGVYKARLEGMPGLSHVTVEVHRCQ
jgi:hypothetical protein